MFVFYYLIQRSAPALIPSGVTNSFLLFTPDRTAIGGLQTSGKSGSGKDQRDQNCLDTRAESGKSI
jgi:hypothetical protein